MASDKPKPADISTEAANASASRDNEFRTVSPISPLFAEESHDLPPPPPPPVPTQASATTPQPATGTNLTTPAKSPTRPLSPQQQAELTLAEAFPTVEATVIKAVLIASRGDIEPAFNALLAMTDPSFVPEEAPPPPRPPRPSAHAPRVDSRYPPQQQQQQQQQRPQRQQQRDYNPALVYQDRIDIRHNQPPTIAPRNQLEADELYARQLAEHYNNAPRHSGRGGVQNQYPTNQRHRRQDSEDDYHSEREHSFIDDDLPVIKENIRQGFLQTQSKVNQWVADLKKKIDGEPTSPELAPAQHYPVRPGASGTGRGGPSNFSSYDADPRVLGDDFAHLELRDNTQETLPKRPPRPVANPNLFQTGGGASSGARKVSFQEIPDDDLYRAPSPRPGAAAATGGSGGVPTKQPSPTTSKWQPLKSAEPTPINGDPFSLGDSDDERDHGLVSEAKAEPKGVDAAKDKGGAAK